MARTKTRRAPRSSAAIAAAAVSPAFSLGRPAILGLAAAILAAFAVLSVFSYTQKSATWDEPLHLAHGYAALTRHDYRVDPGHPPLMRMLAALPLLAVPSVTIETSTIDETAPIDWRPSGQSNLGHRFLYRDNDADDLLYRARFMSVMVGVLLGLLVFFWALEWLGRRRGPSGAGLHCLRTEYRRTFQPGDHRRGLHLLRVRDHLLSLADRQSLRRRQHRRLRAVSGAGGRDEVHSAPPGSDRRRTPPGVGVLAPYDDTQASVPARRCARRSGVVRDLGGLRVQVCARSSGYVAVPLPRGSVRPGAGSSTYCTS